MEKMAVPSMNELIDDNDSLRILLLSLFLELKKEKIKRVL